MGKAVLVMDMPENCYECPFCNDDAECDVVGRPFNQKKDKPDWCPMRQMPEKKSEEVPIAYTRFGAYNDGWNACIDAIGGGEDYDRDCMECPSCDSFLGYATDCKEEHYQDNYCPNCGQKLDWN